MAARRGLATLATPFFLSRSIDTRPPRLHAEQIRKAQEFVSLAATGLPHFGASTRASASASLCARRSAREGRGEAGRSSLGKQRFGLRQFRFVYGAGDYRVDCRRK